MASKKTTSVVSLERIRIDKQTRFNPIRGLTPDILARYLDEFDAGYLFGMALMMEKIKDRDDVLKNVAPKREKAPARRPYEILALDDSPTAQRHKQVLEYFYNHLTCTSAAERNQRGGFALLRRQMMKAVGYRYAVHELVWRPTSEGLTAEFREVPLWFFENVSGKLRYLQGQGMLSGIDLEEGGWMVTVGDGVMIACAVAYMFKRLPLHDWLIYCDRHGMPGVHGKSSAARDSDQWKAMVEAVRSIAADFSCVTSTGESIEKIDFGADGEVPYPKLVERMDRTLAALWRGADLSSMSAGQGKGQGASLQGDEALILESDDCELLSETLNEQVDPWVIRYQTGDETPLAYVRILPDQRKNIELDLLVDEFLVKAGARLGLSNALQRYGRQAADPADAVLQAAGLATAPVNMPSVSLPNSKADHTAAGQFLAAARMQLSRAEQAALLPVARRLNQLYHAAEDQTPDELRAALVNFRDVEIPELLKGLANDTDTVAVLQNLIGTALVEGFTSWKGGAS